ncbi:DUF2145 domain-containing protein [Massilia forsythiae]|uniref:DUF2145 domain-containing protein n=1 Tax=Massilia forsythiae TaxID=2728020 RepID=UPI001E3ADD59|nr:DUF2145 domain-containing protein [Massilia forsythiae]
MLKRLFTGALAAFFLLAGAPAWAGLPTFCDRADHITAADQDRVLRFAAAVKTELARSGERVALIARSGTDLSRFDLVYSHTGIAIKDDADAPWNVRQLYYACDESRPRLFDQGIAGFALGADAPLRGHVALLFLPGEQAAALARAAADKRLALALLAGRYSANAYVFGTRYQNCNQWVAELLANAWGHLDEGDGLATARAAAQAWLHAQGYGAATVRIPSHLALFAGQFVPLVHLDDHPPDDLYALALHVSLPATIEDFVRRQAPAARRVELCHDQAHIVVRHGWEPLGAGCEARPGDEVIALDP